MPETNSPGIMAAATHVAATTSLPAAAPAATLPSVAPAPGERFKISVAAPLFGGMLAGVRFKKGVAFTDNAIAADAILQFGAVVEDRKPPVKD